MFFSILMKNASKIVSLLYLSQRYVMHNVLLFENNVYWYCYSIPRFNFEFGYRNTCTVYMGEKYYSISDLKKKMP